MIIALVRHGQTDYNKQGIIQGHIDNPLNKEGRNQMRILSIHLKEVDSHWDLLGYTTLKRAKESALILNEKLDIPIHFSDKKLIERDFGPLDGKKIELVKGLVAKENYQEPGYEDNATLINRVKDALIDLAKSHSDKKILFVCHSHIIKAALILSDEKKYNFVDTYVSNSSVYYFDVFGGKISFLNKIDLS